MKKTNLEKFINITERKFHELETVELMSKLKNYLKLVTDKKIIKYNITKVKNLKNQF